MEGHDGKRGLEIHMASHNFARIKCGRCERFIGKIGFTKHSKVCGIEKWKKC